MSSDAADVVPELVPVICGQMPGHLLLKQAKVRCTDNGKVVEVTPPEFEKLAGRGPAKKWKSSVRVQGLGQYNLMEVGEYMREVLKVDIKRGAFTPYVATPKPQPDGAQEQPQPEAAKLEKGKPEVQTVRVGSASKAPRAGQEKPQDKTKPELQTMRAGSGAKMARAAQALTDTRLMQHARTVTIAHEAPMASKLSTAAGKDIIGSRTYHVPLCAAWFAQGYGVGSAESTGTRGTSTATLGTSTHLDDATPPAASCTTASRSGQGSGDVAAPPCSSTSADASTMCQDAHAAERRVFRCLNEPTGVVFSFGRAASRSCCVLDLSTVPPRRLQGLSSASGAAEALQGSLLLRELVEPQERKIQGRRSQELKSQERKELKRSRSRSESAEMERPVERSHGQLLGRAVVLLNDSAAEA